MYSFDSFPIIGEFVIRMPSTLHDHLVNSVTREITMRLYFIGESSDIAKKVVIIEVAYSQRRRDLSRLAEAYILGSYAKIKVVVGIDMDYDTKIRTI